MEIQNKKEITLSVKDVQNIMVVQGLQDRINELEKK
jgi:hypothetical protein